MIAVRIAIVVFSCFLCLWCPENLYASQHVVTTPEHRFWVTNRDADRDGKPGGWVEAELLELGDRFRLSDGSEAVLTSTESIYSQVESNSAIAGIEPSTFNVRPHYHTTYNFEVASTHSYFVSLDGIWVHNDCDGRVSQRDNRNFHDPANHRTLERLDSRGTDLKSIHYRHGIAFAPEFYGTNQELAPIRYAHIFYGELNHQSVPAGFYSEGGRSSLIAQGHPVDLNLVPQIVYKLKGQHPQGIYTAVIGMEVDGALIRRHTPQTFFPETMNHIEVLEAIWSATINWTYHQPPWVCGISYKRQLPIMLAYKWGSQGSQTPMITDAFPLWSMEVRRVDQRFTMVESPLSPRLKR